MHWKSFFQQLVLGAAAGAAQFALPKLPTETGVAIKWNNVGNAALLGAILGALTHLSIPQPGPAAAAPAAAPLGLGVNTQAGI